MSAQYYIDGTTLSNSTAIYTDAALTFCAPAGIYSDGFVAREQIVNGTGEKAFCSLAAVQQCPSCLQSCNTNIKQDSPTAPAVYRVDWNVGSTATDVGAVIIGLDPAINGFLVEYDNQVYNKGVRPQGETGTLFQGSGKSNDGGLCQSQNAGNYTVVGVNTTTCGVTSPNGPIGSGYLDVYDYVLNGFVNSGTTESYSIADTDCVLQNDNTTPPGYICVVVPKPSASPSSLLIKLISSCSSVALSDFVLDVKCPQVLTGINSNSTPYSSEEATPCTVGTDSIYVVSTSLRTPTTQPSVRDQVFFDANGANPVTDGWRVYYDPNFPGTGATNVKMETQDGVVITLTPCS